MDGGSHEGGGLTLEQFLELVGSAHGLKLDAPRGEAEISGCVDRMMSPESAGGEAAVPGGVGACEWRGVNKKTGTKEEAIPSFH